MKKNLEAISKKRLKEIAWEIGKKYPIPIAGDHITLLMVNPRLGYIHWQIKKDSLEALQGTHEIGYNGARMVVRIYDVTDVLFDGLNAHTYFDLDVNGNSAHYYFPVDRLGRDYLA